MNVTKEQIDKAKQIDLISYMQSFEPTNLVKKGNDYCTKEHDSLIISDNGLWHWKSRDVAGKTALQYLIKVKDMNFVDAVNFLNNTNPSIMTDYIIADKKKEPFVLPKAHIDNNRVFIYLKCRRISKEVIGYCVRNKLIYESADYHNAVFVGYDGDTPKYAALRGTYQKAKNQFKGEVAGSDKRVSFSITPYSKSNKLIVSESAIDVLSVATLRNNVGKVHYLSIGGAYAPKSHTDKAKMPVALEQYLNDHKEIEEVELCLDNDKVGIGASFFLMQRLMGMGYAVECSVPDEGKDYNDYIASRQHILHNMAVRYIIIENTN